MGIYTVSTQTKLKAWWLYDIRWLHTCFPTRLHDKYDSGFSPNTKEWFLYELVFSEYELEDQKITFTSAYVKKYETQSVKNKLDVKKNTIIDINYFDILSNV